MEFRRLVLLSFLIVPLLASANPSWAQEEDEEEEIPPGARPVLKISQIPSNFKFDGIVNAKNGQAPDSIANLIMVEPEEGGEPESRTVVRAFANQSELIFAIRCYDDDPGGIVSFSKSRDSQLDSEGDVVMLTSEDHVLLVLDTFLDGRSGYVFAVNPSGARFDGLVIEQGEDVNGDWDTVWEAKTSRDASGWYAEIRIPIKSLSFKKDLTTWGFNVQRNVQRLQEISRWSGASQDFEIFQTSRAGLLDGLPSFDVGLGLSIRASLVGVGQKLGPDEDNEFDGDPSLDITQRLGPNLTAALTTNTDFAETEVDVRQINLTRFDLFFPEKRSFFLQGSDIFEFGVGLDEDTFIPFFSRRIGLIGAGEDDLAEIPIDVGGKINGRIGNTNIAALVVNTRQIDSLDVGDADEDIKIHVPDATMGAIRINQNILEESSIGAMATFGDQFGRADSWSGGLDFTYRTSNFLNEKNFVLSLWGMTNDREDLEDDKNAYGLRIEYPNELFDLSFGAVRVGDGFEPSLAFTPRTGVQIWDFSGEFRPRPSWELVRQMTHEIGFRLFDNIESNEWETYEVTLMPLNWQLESGDSFQGGFLLEGDRPDEAFEVASDTDLPSADFAGEPYEWTRYFAGFRTAEKRRFSAGLVWEFGDFYNGDLNTIEGRVGLKVSSFLTLELSTERNTGTVMALPEDTEEEDAAELEETDFTEELFGARLQLNFSPDLQLSSLTQFDNESNELGANIRLRWTFDPLGDFFLVYNHNWVRETDDVRGVKRWQFVSREVPLKLQYALRF